MEDLGGLLTLPRFELGGAKSTFPLPEVCFLAHLKNLSCVRPHFLNQWTDE